LGVTPYHQTELSTCIRHAPGDVLGRSLVERMAEDDVAAFLAQTIARTEGAGAPVDLERPAELLAHQPRHGHVEPLRRAVCRLAGSWHGGRLGAEGQPLGFVLRAGRTGNKGTEEEKRDGPNGLTEQPGLS